MDGEYRTICTLTRHDPSDDPLPIGIVCRRVVEAEPQYADVLEPRYRTRHGVKWLLIPDSFDGIATRHAIAIAVARYWLLRPSDCARLAATLLCPTEAVRRAVAALGPDDTATLAGIFGVEVAMMFHRVAEVTGCPRVVVSGNVIRVRGDLRRWHGCGAHVRLDARHVGLESPIGDDGTGT